MPPKAKGKAKAKAKVKAKAKAKAGAALRRPSARVRMRLRPAAGGEKAKDNKKPLNGIPLADLQKLGVIRLKDAKYYQRDVDLVGMVQSVKLEGDQVYIELYVSGTRDDELLRVLSGKRERLVRVHVCGPDCANVLTGELMVHGKNFEAVDRGAVAWFTNLEQVIPDEGDGEDELEKLRREAEKAKDKKNKGAGGTPKEKKKKKKSKSVERKKRKEDKGKEEESESEDDEEEEEPGRKSLEELFSRTGLDPSFKRRNKVLKRARRLGKGKKKKKKSKKKESESKEEDEESSDSGTSSGGDEGYSLFQSDKKVAHIARRCPGALTCTSLMEAKESLATSSGMTWNLDKKSLPPIYTHFIRQQMADRMSPPILQEALTIGATVDALLQGRVAYGCDILSQRLKALESLSRGMSWRVGREMELIRSEGGSMAEDEEAREAARRARESEKLWNMTSRPSGKGDFNSGGKNKNKGGKGNQKGRNDEWQRGKGGDGKKDDKGRWQGNKKDQ